MSKFWGLLNGSGSDDLGFNWYCDGCHTFMNCQPGFNPSNGEWACTECGFVNDVTPNNIEHYGKRPVTDNQLNYIGLIEDLCDVHFYGTTLEEASDFIDQYRDLYQARLHTPKKYR